MALRLEQIDQQVTNALNTTGAPTNFFETAVTDLAADTNQTVNLNGGGSFWANFGIGKIFTNAVDGIRTFIGLGSNVEQAVIVAHSPITLNVSGFDGQLGIFGSNGDDHINLVNAAPTIEQTVYGFARAVLDTTNASTGDVTAINPSVNSVNWAAARTKELIQNGYTESHALMEVAKVYLQALPGYETMSDEQFVNYLYNQVLGTEVNEAGKAYAMQTLQTWGPEYADNTRADLLKLFVTSNNFMHERGMLAQAEAWGDSVGIRMGMETVVSLADGNDVIRLGLGDNTIIAGPGNKTYEISMYSYGQSDIEFRTYDSLLLIDDRAGAHVDTVNVFVNENGSAAVRLTLENGGIVNIHGDQYLADRVAYAFGVETPAAGQSVEVRGHFEAPVITAALDIKNEVAYQVNPALITPPGEYPENQMITGTNAGENLHGNEHANTLVGLGGNDNISGHDGDDRIDVGTGNNNAWGGAHDDFIVALGGGKNDLSGEAGRDILVGKVGTTLRGGDHEDQFVVGVDNANGTDRAVITDLEAWDVAQFFGLNEDQNVTAKFFKDAGSIELDVNGDKKADVTVFTTDEYVFNVLVDRAGASFDKFGFAQVNTDAAKVNDIFGTSANGEQTAHVDLVGVDADGHLNYTGWHHNIA